MPTLPSTETALVKAFAFYSARWSISGSPTCHPTLKTGFRDVIGSWKIIAIDSPRIPCISDSLSFVRSLPSYITRPLTTRPGGGISRIRLSAVTDLPLPDSPTMPSVSPALSSKDTPSTAFTTPSGVKNWVFRSCTSRRGPGNASYYSPLSLGSNASRTALPKRLAAKTARKIITPGQITSQREWTKNVSEFESTLRHPVIGGGGPDSSSANGD